MCDTIYAGAAAMAASLPVRGAERRGPWFAKNSDRSPDEPQTLCLVPAAPLGAPLVIGGRAFPAGAGRHACALSRPSWMEGGEMGLNDAGVAIGNEAVFPRRPPARDGILGMDILRAALVSCASADETADYLCSFVEEHAQGGNGAYHGKLYYDNSFLVADRKGAWVIETAGRRWARKRVEGLASISNCYSLGRDWDAVDSATAPILDRPGRGRGSWRAHVQNPLYLPFTRGDARRRLTRAALERGPDEGPRLATMISALREHGGYLPGRGGSMASPCVHEGGFPVDNATTASVAVSWPAGTEACVLWFTGSSLPCVSLFKPVLLTGGTFIPLWTGYDYTEGAAQAIEYWKSHREWTKDRRNAALSRDPAFVAARDAAQKDLEGIAEKTLDICRGAGSGPSCDAIAPLQREASAVVAAWEETARLFVQTRRP